MEELLQRFSKGDNVRSEILKNAVAATPAIERMLLQGDNEVVIRLLEEVVAKLPFYAVLALHDTVSNLALRADDVGDAARKALQVMQP